MEMKVKKLAREILELFSLIKGDLLAIPPNDPACRNLWEAWFCYPGFDAIFRHRIEHLLWNHGWKFIALRLSKRTRRLTGVDIHPAAKIGRRFFLDHATGAVVGATAIIGDDVVMFHEVTIGGTGKGLPNERRHAIIGNRVFLSTGAKIIGPVTISDDVKIGACTVVLESISSHNTAVGGHLFRTIPHNNSAEVVETVSAQDGQSKTNPEGVSA